MDRLDRLLSEIISFRNERDWKQFHTQENLAKSIVIEAAELLENFQWGDSIKIDDVTDEIADVLIYVLLMAESLNIDIEEIRRKRMGIDGVVHFLPGIFKDDLKYRSIEKNTASIISSQVSGHEETHQQDKTDLYATDVQIISREGKIYYLPENNAEK